MRIGTQPWIGYGPWWIAQEKGLFAKHGIDAKLVDFVQDTEVNAAFAAGEMDVANLATHTAIKLFANGVDLRVVLLEDASTEADAILAGAAITDVASLKGKTVAYEEGATSDLLLNYALQQNGMTLQDIQAAPMPAADAGSALIAKQVDAAVTYEPYISAAKAQDPSVQVIYSAAADPGLISDVLAARAGFAQENPETMKALLQVWDEAVQFLADNPDEGRAIIAKAVESDPAELDERLRRRAVLRPGSRTAPASATGRLRLSSPTCSRWRSRSAWSRRRPTWPSCSTPRTWANKLVA